MAKVQELEEVLKGLYDTDDILTGSPKGKGQGGGGAQGPKEKGAPNLTEGNPIHTQGGEGE